MLHVSGYSLLRQPIAAAAARAAELAARTVRASPSISRPGRSSTTPTGPGARALSRTSCSRTSRSATSRRRTQRDLGREARRRRHRRGRRGDAAHAGAIVDPTGAGDALAAGLPRRRRPGSRSKRPRAAARSWGRCRDPDQRGGRGGAAATGCGVVALETTLIAHGFPPGEGIEVGLASEAAVRDGGAVPATIGVLDGEIIVGLTVDELERFDASARKLGPRDLAVAAVQGVVGATTVGGTLAICKTVGNRWMATGGLGGVHRGWPTPPDVSADLQALAQTQVLIVSSGIKSLLDVPATAELLETLGVPVLGWRTDELPLFYAARGRPGRVGAGRDGRRSGPDRRGALGARRRRPAARPPAGREPRRRRAADRAGARRGDADGVHGQAVTPFVLAWLHRESGGRTLSANRRARLGNARLAGEVASA